MIRTFEEKIDVPGRMVRGTAAVAVHRVVETIAALFIVPFALHRLGIDAYGLWSLLYAVTVFLNLADLGFAGSLNRHFVVALNSDDRDQQYSVFSTGLAYMVGLGLAIFITGILLGSRVVNFFPEARPFGATALWVWRAMIWVLVLGFITAYARSLFYSTHRVASLAGLNTALALINAGTIVFVLSMGWGLIGLAAGAVLVSVMRLGLTLALGIRGVPGWSVGLSGVRRSTLRRLWAFGLKVHMARLAEVTYFQFDRLLLGRVLGLGAVTHYDIGAKAGSTANNFALIALPVIEPAAATFSTLDKPGPLGELLRQSSKYMAMLAIPLGVYMVLAAEPLLTLWLSSVPHSEVTLALRLLTVAYIIVALTGPLRVIARGAGHPEWEASTATVQALLNIVFSIGLYFVFGFIGVLVGTLLAALVGQVALTRIVLRGLKEPVSKFIQLAWIGPLGSTALAGLFAWAVLRIGGPLATNVGRIDVLPSILASGTVFLLVNVAALLFFRVVTIGEFKGLLSHLISKRA